MLLPKSFYLREDVVQVSKDLLGKVLMTDIDGKLTGGVIVETEAYHGPEDKASHAYNGRRTERTEIMYAEGGVAYVYLIYGLHYLFNVITNKKDIPHAVLVRAIEPLDGIDTMLERRKKKYLDKTIASGPGSLTKAMGITKSQNGIELTSGKIWLEDRGIKVPAKNIHASPRVGIDYAEDWVSKPWRFRIKDNPWTGK